MRRWLILIIPTNVSTSDSILGVNFWGNHVANKYHCVTELAHYDWVGMIVSGNSEIWRV